MAHSARSLGIALLAAPLGAAAQAPASGGPPPAPGAVTWQGSLRVRPEHWDWFGAGGGRYGYLGLLARASLQQQRARVGWRVELAAPAVLGLPDDALRPPPRGQQGFGAAYWAANDSAESPVGLFVKQAYVRLGAPPKEARHSLRLGRFEYSEGAETAPEQTTLAALKRDRVAQRLLAPFGFTHVGRSFDGAHYAFTHPAANVALVAALPTRGALDVNGWSSLNVRLGYGALTRPFTWRGGAGEWRVFGLLYQDRRNVLKTDNRPAAARAADLEDVSAQTLGAHYAHVFVGGLGEADLLLWGALQGGSWGAQDHRAHAEVAELGWQPPAKKGALRPWLRVGWDRGSGDDDPGDDEHRTFFQVLPTARVYARFPFYDMMNSEDLFASLYLRGGALRTVTLRADAHRLRLTRAEDLWYSGGGAFEPNSFGYAGRPSAGARDLATLVDLSADWKVNDHLSLVAYGAAAPPGRVIERTYPDGSGAGHLLYLEAELRR